MTATMAWLKELEAAWPIILFGLGLLAAAWRQIRRKVIDPINRTAKLVEYHLGPNGTTPPVWFRLQLMEKAHRIEHDEDATL